MSTGDDLVKQKFCVVFTNGAVVVFCENSWNILWKIYMEKFLHEWKIIIKCILVKQELQRKNQRRLQNAVKRCRRLKFF